MMEYQVKFCHHSGPRLWRTRMLFSTKSKGHKSNFRISWMYRSCFYDLKVHFWWPNKCSKHQVLRSNTLYLWPVLATYISKAGGRRFSIELNCLKWGFVIMVLIFENVKKMPNWSPNLIFNSGSILLFIFLKSEIYLLLKIRTSFY